jgi:hypothetical protein
MDSQYEVLSPWAESDPVPLSGLTPRVPDLSHKKMGLFVLDYKHASDPVQRVVERKLREKFPDIEISRFIRDRGGDFDNPSDTVGSDRKPDDQETLAKFEEWVKEVDAVIGAVGD